ncbi:hypothetical protein ABTX60_06955 [Streptomyces sp. NPDC126510]|uniref:hypothetical protein n=1 Tax=Streptomyces sp. NPDC126510 TaxID=3155317 RepID=UPI0033269980
MTVDHTRQRWQITYRYPASPEAYWARDGRESNTTYLNNGEELLSPEEAAAIVAKQFGHEGPLSDIRVWQESPEERDQRLEARRREKYNEARGHHWAMGGAN